MSDASSYRLSRTLEDVTCTETTNSSVLQPMFATVVAANQFSEGMDAMKFLLQFTPLNVNVAATTVSVTLQIYDISNSKLISVYTLNVTDVVNNFKNNPTVVVDYRTILISGLRPKISIVYDAVWQVKLSISDPSLQVSIQAIQRLYYKM